MNNENISNSEWTIFRDIEGNEVFRLKNLYWSGSCEIPLNNSEIPHNNENNIQNVDVYQESSSTTNNVEEIKLFRNEENLENNEMSEVNLLPYKMLNLTELETSLINKEGDETIAEEPSSIQNLKSEEEKSLVAMQPAKIKIYNKISSIIEILRTHSMEIKRKWKFPVEIESIMNVFNYNSRLEINLACYLRFFPGSEPTRRVKQRKQNVLPQISYQPLYSGDITLSDEKCVVNPSEEIKDLPKYKTKQYKKHCTSFETKIPKVDYVRPSSPRHIRTSMRTRSSHPNILETQKARCHQSMSPLFGYSNSISREKGEDDMKYFREMPETKSQYLRKQSASKEIHSSSGMKNRKANSGRCNSKGRERKDNEINKGRDGDVYDGKYYTCDLPHEMTQGSHEDKRFHYRFTEKSEARKTNTSRRKRDYGIGFIKKTLEIKRINSLFRRQMDVIHNYVKRKECKRKWPTAETEMLKYPSKAVEGNEESEVQSKQFQGKISTLEDMESFFLSLKENQSKKRKKKSKNHGVKICKKTKLTYNQTDSHAIDLASEHQKASEVEQNKNCSTVTNQSQSNIITDYKEIPKNVLLNKIHSQGVREKKENRKSQFTKREGENFCLNIHKSKNYPKLAENSNNIIQDVIIDPIEAFHSSNKDKKARHQKKFDLNIPEIVADFNQEIGIKNPSYGCLFPVIGHGDMKELKSKCPSDVKNVETEKNTQLVSEKLPSGCKTGISLENVKEYWDEETTLEEMEEFVEKLRALRMKKNSSLKRYKSSIPKADEMALEQMIVVQETPVTQVMVTPEKEGNIEPRARAKYAYFPSKKAFRKIISDSNKRMNKKRIHVEQVHKIVFGNTDEELIGLKTLRNGRNGEETEVSKEGTNLSFDLKSLREKYLENKGRMKEKDSETSPKSLREKYLKNEERKSFVAEKSQKLLNIIRRKRKILKKIS